MLLGLSSSYFGGVIASYLDYLLIIAGLVIIILGVHFTGLISLGFLNREMRVHQLPKSADFGGTISPVWLWFRLDTMRRSGAGNNPPSCCQPAGKYVWSVDADPIRAGAGAALYICGSIYEQFTHGFAFSQKYRTD